MKEPTRIFDVVQLSTWQKAIHENAVIKGFWEDDLNPNRGEKVMLIISELAECLESHRLNKVTADLDAAWMESSNDFSHLYDEHFPETIKDTVEDEMADVVIRILDYTEGLKLPIHLNDYKGESKNNFGADLLELVKLVLQAYDDETSQTKNIGWGHVITAVEAFCNWYKIDIESHIKWKMVYNSRRAYKHNKKY